MVGGGYGTGREIIEYFTRFGAYGGLMALLISFVIMAIVIVATFELARLFSAYDYRSLMKVRLGCVTVREKGLGKERPQA